MSSLRGARPPEPASLGDGAGGELGVSLARHQRASMSVFGGRILALAAEDDGASERTARHRGQRQQHG